jgi:hypothetical protein
MVAAARRGDPRAKALFLPFAVVLLVLLGTAATAGFALRYLVPLVAELAMAGTLAFELLFGGRGRSVPAPSRLVPEKPE